jgi:hypothetical protein
MVIPILDRAGESVVGTINLESDEANAFDGDVQDLLESCAEVIRPLWDMSSELSSEFTLHVRYSGPSVSGSIPLRALLQTIQRLAALFEGTNRTKPLRRLHTGDAETWPPNLRLLGAHAGSFELVFGLILPELTAAAQVTSSAMAVIATITSVIVALRTRKDHAQIDRASPIEDALIKLGGPLRQGNITSIELRAEYRNEVIGTELTLGDRRLLLNHRAEYAKYQQSPERVWSLPQVRDSTELSSALRASIYLPK